MPQLEVYSVVLVPDFLVRASRTGHAGGMDMRIVYMIMYQHVSNACVHEQDVLVDIVLRPAATIVFTDF